MYDTRDTEKQTGELQHYGVIGMKWGIRRTQAALNRANRKGDTAKATKLKGKLAEKKSIQKMKVSDKIFLSRQGVLANQRLIEKGESKAKRLVKLHGVSIGVSTITSKAGQKGATFATQKLKEPTFGKMAAIQLATGAATLATNIVARDQIYKQIGRGG